MTIPVKHKMCMLFIPEISPIYPTETPEMIKNKTFSQDPLVILKYF